MGWERKRGKLAEFNRLLRGATDTSFVVRHGDLSVLPSVRYVITLDSDTQLPMDAARRLVGTLAHPLNRPRFDPRARARDRRLRRAAAARRRQPRQREPDGVREGLLRPRRRRSVHDRGLRRLSGPVSRGQLRRQGHLRRRRVRGGARRTACRRTRCSATTCSKGPTRAPGCAPTSTWSTTTRRTTWRSPRGSTAGCAATGRSRAGSGARCPTRRGRAGAATRCRSSRAGRSSTTCAAACSPPALVVLLVAGWTVLPGSPLLWTVLGAAGARLPGLRPGRPLAVEPRARRAAPRAPRAPSATTSSPARGSRCCRRRLLRASELADGSTRSAARSWRLLVTRRRLLEWVSADRARAARAVAAAGRSARCGRRRRSRSASRCSSRRSRRRACCWRFR